MTSIKIENRADGRFALELSKGSSTDIIGFPREFNLDLALHEVDSDSILVAALLVFQNKVWQKKIDKPSSSSGLTERMFESGVPPEWIPVVERNAKPADYSLLRQNTMAVLPVNSFQTEFDAEGPGRLIVAHPLDVSDWTGRIFGPSHIYFGTNLPLFSSLGGVHEAALRLALGILVANDLRIGKVVIPGKIEGIVEDELRAMTSLASSIGLEVEFGTAI